MKVSHWNNFISIMVTLSINCCRHKIHTFILLLVKNDMAHITLIKWIRAIVDRILIMRNFYEPFNPFTHPFFAIFAINEIIMIVLQRSMWMTLSCMRTMIPKVGSIVYHIILCSIIYHYTQR